MFIILQRHQFDGTDGEYVKYLHRRHRQIAELKLRLRLAFLQGKD